MKPGDRQHVLQGTKSKITAKTGGLKPLIVLWVVAGSFGCLGGSVFGQETPSPIRAVEGISVDSSYGKLPSLWHIRMTGADWAKVALQKAGFQKSRVVVMDDRIDVGADGEIVRPVRAPRMIKNPLLNAVRPDFKNPETSAVGVLSLLFSYFKVLDLEKLPEEILDPRESELKDHGTHGTHVAGTIGAKNAIYGVSPAASVFTLPVFDFPSYTQDVDIRRVLEFIGSNEKEAFVLNVSLEFSNRINFLSDFQKLLSRPDIAMVLSSGNSGKLLRNPDLRCQISGATVVGAAAPTGTLAMFSNFGDCIDLVAPGVGILSRGDQMELDGEQLQIMEGTSMAAPMVSGAMANLRAIIPSLTSAQMKKILLKTAWDLDAPGRDTNTGNGMLNVLKATVIAIKLREQTGGDTAAIDLALDDSHLFSTGEMALSAELERTESCLGCPSKMDELYRVAMLSEDTGRMKDLAQLPENQSTMLRFGYQFMAYNRVDALMTPEEVTKFSKTVIAYQNSLMAMRRETKIFQSLSNPSLILKIGESLKGRKDLEALFQQRMALVAPERLSELKLAMMSDEEKKATLTQGQVATSKKESSLDPVSVCLPVTVSSECPSEN